MIQPNKTASLLSQRISTSVALLCAISFDTLAATTSSTNLARMFAEVIRITSIANRATAANVTALKAHTIVVLQEELVAFHP